MDRNDPSPLSQWFPKVTETYDSKVASTGIAVLRALRPHQWSKNTLLLLPLLLAHDLQDFGKLMMAMMAMIAFSACASGVYVANDMLDLESDRRHPVKKHRPLASGALPIGYGPPLAAAMLVMGFIVSLVALPRLFSSMLALYVAMSMAYSYWLKRRAIVDVLVLAGLYTIRVLAGGVATGVLVSEWLLALSLFLFTSLALVKRYAELSRLADDDAVFAQGRGYRVSDLSLLESMGTASGYVAVPVMALYINSDEVTQLHENVWALWLVCPLLLYWISRMWMLARHRKLLEDPVVFALTDRVSLIVGVVIALLIVVAAAPW